MIPVLLQGKQKALKAGRFLYVCFLCSWLVFPEVFVLRNKVHRITRGQCVWIMVRTRILLCPDSL